MSELPLFVRHRCANSGISIEYGSDSPPLCGETFRLVSVMNFSPLAQGKRIAESREEEVKKASSHEYSRTRTADPTGQSHQFSA